MKIVCSKKDCEEHAVVEVEGCPAHKRREILNESFAVLAQRGWTRWVSRSKRRDYCPKHKPRENTMLHDITDTYL